MASDAKKAAKLAAQGVGFHQVGQVAAAEDCYRRSLALDGKNIDALHLLGVILRGKGELAEAQKLIALSLTINPRQHGALNNLAEIEMQLGQCEQAVKHLHQALRLAPDLQQAAINLPVALARCGRQEEAAAAFAQALLRYPGHGDLRTFYAQFLADAGREGEARAQLDEAPSPAAQSLAGLRQRARLLSRLMDHGGAAACLNEIYRRDGGALWARLEERFELDMACDWSRRGEMAEELRVRLQEGAAVQPFPLLALVDDPRLHLEAARRHAAALALPAIAPAALAARKPPGERLRIGYLSADFHAHATAFLLAGVLESHDRSRFEIHAYSTGPHDGSPMRARLEAACEHFVDLAGVDAGAIASRIALDGIDILVDLKGYTQDSPSAVLRARPAPIQVNYLGYPGSLGMAEADYLIADPVIVPEELKGHYSEQVVRLPVCYQPNDARRETAPIPSRAAAGLPEDAVVLCSFNRTYKYSPAMFDLWCGMLRAHPEAVLWLLVPGEAVAANLRREAAERGIGGERLIFAPPKPPAEHWARLALADVFVDTFPYGAHTTASDALWMGVPVVTRTGQSFASRVAASILAAVGLPELAAADDAGYRALLERLVADGEWRRQVRRQLAETGRQAPLFATERYARELEWAYGEMARRHEAGLGPAGFDVPAGGAGL